MVAATVEGCGDCCCASTAELKSVNARRQTVVVIDAFKVPSNADSPMHGACRFPRKLAFDCNVDDNKAVEEEPALDESVNPVSG